MNWIDLLGWAGTIMIVYAYHWSSNTDFKDNKRKVLQYQLLNILGAFGLVVNSTYYGAVPSVILNAIWIVIAIQALFKMKEANEISQPELA